MKKALDTTSDRMAFVKEGITKVQQKEWAEPLGTAMGVTASICNGIGNFVPGFGYIGGAINIGSKILNPAPSLADIKRSEKEILEHLDGTTGIVKKTLERQLEALRDEIKNPQPEILKDMQSVKQEVQSCVSDMTEDMRRIEEELCDVKDVINHTYQLVRDVRYRDGIEKVEAAYENFIKGSNNLDNTFNRLEGYMFELESLAIQNLNPVKVGEYLRSILLTEDIEIAQHIFKYILVVRSKYLQLVCAYYIFKEEPDRVCQEFDSFNKNYDNLCEVFKTKTGIEFKPDQLLSDNLLSRCRIANKMMPDITQTKQLPSPTFNASDIKNLLSGLGLEHLIEVFEKEAVTMDTLKILNDEDLKTLGVVKCGDRRKILNSVSKIRVQSK